MLERDFDAILLGAFGDPRVASNIHAKEILLGMRFKMDLYANVRPVRLLDASLCPLKGVEPKDIDFVVVRENTEGVYVDAGGPAVAGLVVPEKAVLDGLEVPFKKTGSGYRAEFPTWALVPEADLPDKLPFGVVAPVPKLYSMYVTLTAAKPGEALATLRIGPLGLAGTKGSALQGKSFRVVPPAAPAP